jgi:hypothetical protein
MTHWTVGTGRFEGLEVEAVGSGLMVVSAAAGTPAPLVAEFVRAATEARFCHQCKSVELVGSGLMVWVNGRQLWVMAVEWVYLDDMDVRAERMVCDGA